MCFPFLTHTALCVCVLHCPPAGLVYQWLLMRGVDHVMVAASGSSRQAAALRGEAGSSSSSNNRSGSGTNVRHGVYGSGTSSVNGSSGAKQGQQSVSQQSQEGYESGADETTSSGVVARVFGSTPLRLGFVCASAALGLALLGQEEAGECVQGRGLGMRVGAAGWGCVLW